MDVQEMQYGSRVEAQDRLLSERPSTAWGGTSAGVIEMAFDSPETPPSVWIRSDGLTSLLYRGKVHGFIGPKEGCKTWAACAVGADEIRKGNAFLMIDRENSLTAIARRLRTLGLTRDQVRDGFVYVSPTCKWDDTASAHLEQRLAVNRQNAREVTFAVLDSVTGLMSLQGLNPTRGDECERFFQGVPHMLKAENVTTVVIDHTPKGDESGPIGSERKSSGVDANLLFKMKAPAGRHKTGLVQIRIGKDRTGYLEQFAISNRHIATLVLTSDGEHMHTELRAPGQGGTDYAALSAHQQPRRTAALTAVRNYPGSSKSELRKLIGGDTTKTGELIQQLVEEGVIRVESGGGKRQIYYLAENHPENH